MSGYLFPVCVVALVYFVLVVVYFVASEQLAFVVETALDLLSRWLILCLWLLSLEEGQRRSE